MTVRIYQIMQGLPITASSTLQLLPSGLTGTRGALRRLVHPDTANFPALIYYQNPTRTYNFDSDVLRHPLTALTRTLSSSKLVRFEEVTEDVVITEVWEPGGGLSMPLFLARQLYEYVLNPPAFAAIGQTYITWEPRDETDSTWNVELIEMQVGSGSPGKYNFKKYQSWGGPNDLQTPGPVLTPTDTMDVSPTALIDQAVSVTMRVVSQAS